MFNDSIRDLLGFNARTLYEEYNLSPDPVDIISFDKILIETDIARGMIFKGKRSGILMNFTMSVSAVLGIKIFVDLREVCNGI